MLTAEFLAKRYELRNSPIKMELEFTKNEEATIDVRITWEVPDRETGASCWVSQAPEYMTAIKPFWELEYVDSLIATWLEKAFVHEFREAFHVSGVRVLDPHKEKE